MTASVNTSEKAIAMSFMYYQLRPFMHILKSILYQDHKALVTKQLNSELLVLFRNG